jgi:hypothetical protein
MGGGASLPSEAKLRRMIFIKLHNCSKDKGKSMQTRLKETFAKYDDDGNGWITSEEFALAVGDFGVAGITEDQINLLVALFDNDGDGKISYTEFQEFIMLQKPVETACNSDEDALLKLAVNDSDGNSLGQLLMSKADLDVSPFNRKVSYRLTTAPGEGSVPATGTLTCKIAYPRYRVWVDILRCTGVRKADVFGASDCYVSVLYQPTSAFGLSEIHSTEVVEKTLNPVWARESCEVQLPQKRALRDSKLQLEVYDKDGAGSDDFLGQASVQGDVLFKLAEASGTKGVEHTFQLDTRAGCGQKITGDITCRLRLGETVQISVVDAQGLNTAPMKSRQPVCLGTWNRTGVEVPVLLTGKAHNARNPVWDTDVHFDSLQQLSNADRPRRLSELPRALQVPDASDTQ